MPSNDLFHRFAALHVPGSPLVLFNVWDAGSAGAVAKSGARAIAFPAVASSSFMSIGSPNQLASRVPESASPA